MTRFALVAIGSVLLGALPAAQSMNATDALRARNMLREAYETVRQHYYDPAFHGLDWDAHFREYGEKLKTAPSLNAAVAMVAGFLDGLKDSHTLFSPPARPFQLDYGYRVGLVGDDAFITRVRPGTDAASKVTPGDRVIAIDGNPVARESFLRMQYILSVLSPRPTTTLVLRDRTGQQRTVLVNAKVTPGQIVRNLTGPGAGMQIGDLIREAEDSSRLVRQRYVELGDVMIWKMPLFFVEEAEIDRLFGVARRHAA